MHAQVLHFPQIVQKRKWLPELQGMLAELASRFPLEFFLPLFMGFLSFYGLFYKVDGPYDLVACQSWKTLFTALLVHTLRITAREPLNWIELVECPEERFNGKAGFAAAPNIILAFVFKSARTLGRSSSCLSTDSAW